MANQERIEEQDILEKSILYLIEVIGKNIKLLIGAFIFGGVLGVGLSFMAPKKYTSNAELLPEYSKGNLGNLGSLASLAGIDAGSGNNDAIRPDLYPNILQSNPAILHLLSKPVESLDGKKYATLLQYYEEKEELKTPKSFLTKAVRDSIIRFESAEMVIISSLRGSIKSSFDKNSGLVQIGIEMKDPKVATITLVNCISYLRESINQYHYGKSHDQGTFIKGQLTKAKDRMTKARYTLQKYRDNNRNLYTNAAKIQEQKLQEDYSIAFSVYNELLGESERLNISGQEEKPLFQVLNPPVIPNTRSSPNRLFFGVGGSILVSIMVFISLLIPWRRIF